MSLLDEVNATLAIKIADAIGKYHRGFFTKRVLKTMEEVEANTNPKNLPSALVVGELINDLGGCSFETKEDGAYVKYTLPGGADPVLKKLGSTAIFIPSITFNVGCSGNSYVSSGSSVGTNSINASGSCTTKFTIFVDGFSTMTVGSGECSYTLKDSNGILPDKTGTLNNGTPIDISAYDTIELSKYVATSASGVGTHNSSASNSGTVTITNLRIE